MAFLPVFGRSFSPTFDRRNAAGEWWNLFGAIPNANVIAAYQAKGAASQAASYINLVTPGTYNAAPGTAPTWDATNGWIFLATSAQYLTTGITPASGWSMIVRFASVTNQPALFGSLETNANFYIAPNRSGTTVRYASGNILNVGANLLTGTLGISGQQGYRNGAADGGAISAWAAASTLAMFLGAYNSAGSAALFMTGNIQAIAFYNIILTAPQNALLYTAINAI